MQYDPKSALNENEASESCRALNLLCWIFVNTVILIMSDSSFAISVNHKQFLVIVSSAFHREYRRMFGKLDGRYKKYE